MKKMIVNTKRFVFALMMMLTVSVSASAMSYEQARNEALFLTDKMAYELNLTDAQYEAAYEINLDYLMSVATVNDVFGVYWERRNLDLSYILYSWQWDAFRAATYFYRPLYWDRGYWHFGIYARYPHRDYFYFGRPHFYATYRGGHSWHMNGGRSFYHGRDSHFRPALPNGSQHIGMRNGYDRGDYRGGRTGSSTRITGRQNQRFNDSHNRSLNERTNRSFNERTNRSSNERTNRSFNERTNRNEMNSNRNGNYDQPNGGRLGGNRSTGNIENRSNRSTVSPENRNSRPSGSVGSSASPSRSFGGSRSSGSMGSSASPTRSFGGSRSSGSVGSNHSSRSGSNSHGHFGGSRSR